VFSAGFAPVLNLVMKKLVVLDEVDADPMARAAFLQSLRTKHQ
jgi:hypothetical protein